MSTIDGEVPFGLSKDIKNGCKGARAPNGPFLNYSRQVPFEVDPSGKITRGF